MTSYPPPGPPQGEPGGQYPPQQYPPQQQYGQYGGPQSQPPKPAKPAFDFSSINPLDWALFGAALVAFIFSFMSFYTGTVSATVIGRHVSESAHENGWHGFFGWFAVLLVLAASALLAMLIFAPQVKLPVSGRLLVLGSYALATLFMIIAIFVTPGKADAGALPFAVKVDYGRGFGFWIVFIAIAAGLVLAFLRYQQTGGDLAALFSGGSKQTTGMYGPLQNQPPQQGYQQQAPSGYQSPPAYQQQGYQPQPPPGGYQPPAGYQPPPPQQPGYQPPPAPPAPPQTDQPPTQG